MYINIITNNIITIITVVMQSRGEKYMHIVLTIRNFRRLPHYQKQWLSGAPGLCGGWKVKSSRLRERGIGPI